jgi:hypothetical protein
MSVSAWAPGQKASKLVLQRLLRCSLGGKPADLPSCGVATGDPIPVRRQGLAVRARCLQLEQLTLLDHDPNLLDRLRIQESQPNAPPRTVDHLSEREGVTASTRANVLTKLQVTDRPQAIVKAREAGLISTPSERAET